jgi:hypothetical protein
VIKFPQTVFAFTGVINAILVSQVIFSSFHFGAFTRIVNEKIKLFITGIATFTNHRHKQTGQGLVILSFLKTHHKQLTKMRH